MKRVLFFSVLICFLFTGCLLPKSTKSNKTKPQASIDPEIKACFDLVNEFRTGKEAYYWNKNNITKTKLVGKLGKLTLDEELCRAAQLRANELVTKFDHTRPNGSSCFTVLKECSISYSCCAENIAAGNKSGAQTFIQWKEDKEKYKGQGHRRNMLGNYTKIGIAYVYDPNSKYKYYWEMILAK